MNSIIVLCSVIASIALVVAIVWLLKRQARWTRCYFCGIYTDQHGNTTWIPADGTVGLQKSVCKRCLNNEEQADAYGRRS